MREPVVMQQSSAPDFLAAEHIDASYGRIDVLKDVTVRVGQGQLVCLIGANGAGKTTLLKVLSGLMPCRSGSIRLRGTNIGRLSSDKRVRAGVGQVPENRQIFGPLSVEDNLKLGGYTRPAVERVETLAEVYHTFPILQERRHHPALTLSGGQQQMLAIGRALMARPTMLLLDEPSMGLAPLLVAEVFSIISRLRASGLSILLVEQNAQAALAIADEGYVLESGRIVLHGKASALLTDSRVQKSYLGM
jgi:branched-chain amino acid transport system ATP-binding protein